jgi:Caspase domain
MSRYALIIGAPGAGEDYLKGVDADLANMRTWLESPVGGAWKSDEIKVLRNASKDLIAAWVNVANFKDYAFVYFSGHGECTQGKYGVMNQLWVTDNQLMSQSEVTPTCKKKTVILDSCRKLKAPYVRQFAEARLKAAAVRPDAAACRALFDQLVAEADEGCSAFYSCSVNQTARDTDDGGLYSRALIDSAGEWGSIQRTSTALGVLTAHNQAAIIVKANNPSQVPDNDRERRLRHFPFAVHAVR